MNTNFNGNFKLTSNILAYELFDLYTLCGFIFSFVRRIVDRIKDDKIKGTRKE